MSDFSLTTLFVVPASQTTLPNGTSPTGNASPLDDLTAGKIGIFIPQSGTSISGIISSNVSGTIAGAPYFQIAQGRANTYLQGTKKSDKISGVNNTGSKGVNVTEWYKVAGSATANNQVTKVTNWNVKAGDIITITLRAHSSYIDTLYFNGFTRSVTVQAPCLNCGDNPCDTVDQATLIDLIMEKFTGYNVTNGVIDWNSPIANAPANGINPDNISFNTFFTFSREGSGPNYTLVITGKALTPYGQPCDIAAFPYEYDRMYFRTFVYSGPATTADFIVADACNIVATATVTTPSTYPKGTANEIKQLEKNFYSYQAGYLKHLFRMVGYDQNFESYADSTAYDTYYIKFNDYDKTNYQWGDYIHQDSTVIIAVSSTNGFSGTLQSALAAALGSPTVV